VIARAESCEFNDEQRDFIRRKTAQTGAEQILILRFVCTFKMREVREGRLWVKCEEDRI